MIRDLLDSCKIYKDIKDKTIRAFPGKNFHGENAYYTLEFYRSFGTSTEDVRRKLLTLDEEDIAYFMNKYLPKLQDELNEEINKLKAKYEG